ncbi:MAG: cyclic nucleotide-binding domain-containing protein [Methyloprofundus sp.]|nr:cyclic nucleotide-binding domain-containing protein [Methyloprofundus sp.]
MAADSKLEASQTLRKLIPFITMPALQFKQLYSGIKVIEVSQGNFLFKNGDATNAFFYLIEGSVSLEAHDFKIEAITAGTEAAKFALAHQFPRKISARAIDNVRYVSLSLNIFDKQVTGGEEKESTYMVENNDLEADEPNDWMSVLLKSPIFQRLPAMNLQQILISLEEVRYEKGEVIVSQGDPGDYYYIIRKGCCALSRKASERAKEIKLLELCAPDTFGEDALLSGETRSMTITAMGDMVLSRIDKERFIKLIKEPVLTYIDYADICNQNDMSILDIRPTDAYSEHHIRGSENIPFFSLRMRVKDFKKESNIVIVCDDGSLSAAAAFFLIKNKLDALILKGGMNSVPSEAESSNKASFAIDESGVETEVFSQDDETEEGSNEELELTMAPVSEETREAGAGLQQDNQDLKLENKRLTSELESLKKQYRMLFKQTERLKAVLDKLQESK